MAKLLNKFINISNTALLNIKNIYSLFIKWIISDPARYYLIAFTLLCPIIIFLDIYFNIDISDVIVELNGLLFDTIVFGILLMIYDTFKQRQEKFEKDELETKTKIERLKEEIDDFRYWRENESKYRILGNIKRLNKLGVTDIDLRFCFLSNLDLSDLDFENSKLDGANLSNSIMNSVNLKGTTLKETNFFKANLEGANLESAYMRETNLEETNLQSAILCKAYINNAIFKNTILDDCLVDLKQKELLISLNIGGNTIIFSQNQE